MEAVEEELGDDALERVKVRHSLGDVQREPDGLRSVDNHAGR